MGYITFIADGKEINVYCGYISNIVIQDNHVVNMALSNPRIEYNGDSFRKKLNLQTVKTLSLKKKDGTEVPFTITESTIYAVPMSARFKRDGTRFIFVDGAVQGEKFTRRRFQNNTMGFETIISDELNTPLYYSSLATITNFKTGIVVGYDYQIFQTPNTNVLTFFSAPLFKNLNWCPQISDGDEIGGNALFYPFLISRGKFSFPTRGTRLKGDDIRYPAISGESLYITAYGTWAFNDKQRGMIWDNKLNSDGYFPLSEQNYLSSIVLNNSDITPPPDEVDEPDEGGDGDEDDSTDNIPLPIPPPIFPTASKLFTLYTIQPDQLEQLGSILWSETFKDTIFGVNQSPVDAIIDIFALPIRDMDGSTRTVTIGNTETTMQATVPTDWTITINCGNLYVQRYYDDFIDYMAKYEIYLPFIGLRSFNTDLTGTTINLQYIIDLLTGNCTAFIYDVNGKNGLSSCLYTFNGNCSYSIPYTAQNLRNQAVKRLSGIGNTVISAAQGNIMGVARNMLGYGLNELESQANIQTEDTGGCASYLNIMIPFIIATRVKKHKNNYYEKLGNIYYFPTTYSNLIGYTEIVNPNLKLNNLTIEENSMINDLLQKGVIF